VWFSELVCAFNVNGLSMNISEMVRCVFVSLVCEKWSRCVLLRSGLV